MSTKIIQKPIVFMKVGTHANETFDDILNRKRREYEATGKSFWGYGGGTMHPLTKLQPFARYHIEHGDQITLIMEEIKSNHWESAVATEYSKDGVNWEPIPKGIEVRGSRYALVLDEIKPGDLAVDLAHYVVGIGPSEGKNASTYISGRVDKGCLNYVGPPNTQVTSRIIKSTHAATLKEPFGVLLRGPSKGD
jgi:hypothetical protein